MTQVNINVHNILSYIYNHKCLSSCFIELDSILCSVVLLFFYKGYALEGIPLFYNKGTLLGVPLLYPIPEI